MLSRIASIALYEVRREFRKKSFYLILLLAFLPLPVAYIVRVAMSDTIRELLRTASRVSGFDVSMSWSLVLGVEQPPSQLAGLQVLLHAASLAGWTWLIAILYGGDLLASDARDAALPLLLSRPVTRLEYLLGKVLTVTGFLSALYIVAGVVAFASMWVIFGPQRAIHEAIAFSLLLAVSTLPLLLASAALGYVTRNPTLGIILGFVAYFTTGTIVSMYALVSSGVFGATTAEEYMRAQAEAARLMAYGQAANPFTAGATLAAALYALIHHGGRYMLSVMGPPVALDAGSLAAVSTASLALSTLALLAVTLLVLRLRDV